MITCLVLAEIGEAQARTRLQFHDAEEEGGRRVRW